ncbi:tetratricopeptide repeat protein [Cryomorphaceae bacterium]|nr:tetratricopeptide repeat protein [Cryomorphaceae bacterium]
MKGVVLVLGMLSISISTYSQTSSSVLDSVEALMRVRQYDDALKLINQSELSQPSRKSAYLKGSIYQRLFQEEKAWISCSELLSLDSNWTPGLTLSAEVANATGRDTTALVLWQKLVRKYPESSRYHRQFASTSLRLGVLPLAIHHYEQAVRLNPFDISSLAQVVELYEGLQNWSVADSMVQRALEYQPARRELYLLGARIGYRSERFWTALPYLESADSLGTLSPTWNEIYGISLYRSGYVEESIPVLRRLHPNDAEEGPTYVLAMAYYRLEKFDSAAVYFEKAATLATSDELPVYYEFQGRSLQSAGYPELAVNAYKNSYYYDPSDPVFTYLIARAFDEAGNREQAEAYYKSYIEKETDQESDYYQFSVDRLTQWRRADFFKGE